MEIVTIGENRYMADALVQLGTKIVPAFDRPVFGFAVSSYGGCRTETERLQGVSQEYMASAHLADTATAAMVAIVRARGLNINDEADLESEFRGSLTPEELAQITAPTCANCGAPVNLPTDHYYSDTNQELVAGCV